MFPRASSGGIHNPLRARCAERVRKCARCSSRAQASRSSSSCAGIHMSEIPAFPYAILWGERRVVSVTNLTRRDGEEFLALAPRVPVRTSVETFPLERANEALARLREGRICGAAVLVVQEPRATPR